MPEPERLNEVEETVKRLAQENRKLAAIIAEMKIFRRLVERSREGISLFSLKGQITYANRTAYRLYGCNYARRDAEGTYLHEYLLPESWAIVQADVLPRLRQNLTWEGQLHYHRAGVLETVAFGLRDSQGRLIHCATLSHTCGQAED